MKKEKNRAFYLRGISFCNKELREVYRIQISIWWSLLPLIIVSFLFDIELIAGVEFRYFIGVLATIGCLTAWYSITLKIVEVSLSCYRKYCIKKVESFSIPNTCDKR